jgi:transcriptional regulator with XRE-family HTH domain
MPRRFDPVNLRELRLRAGLTQARLGQQLPNSCEANHARRVSFWETGRGRPSLDVLPDLAKALGVTIDALFTEAQP